MSATATPTTPAAPTTYFELLDRIEGLARQALAGIPQQRQFLQHMLGGQPQNGVVAPVVIPAVIVPPASPVSEDDVRGVPDASKIVAATKKKAAAKKPTKKAGTPAADSTPTEGDTGATAEQPSLRSVCWAILTRPENTAAGLRAGGEGHSVLKTILDEKLWVSKSNGNMAQLVSQCLHQLKKQGKVTRNAETFCFIAKTGVTLD